MWDIILKALLKELESNPDRVLTIIEEVLQILKSNPTAVTTLVSILQKQVK